MSQYETPAEAYPELKVGLPRHIVRVDGTEQLSPLPEWLETLPAATRAPRPHWVDTVLPLQPTRKSIRDWLSTLIDGCGTLWPYLQTRDDTRQLKTVADGAVPDDWAANAHWLLSALKASELDFAGLDVPRLHFEDERGIWGWDRLTDYLEQCERAVGKLTRGSRGRRKEKKTAQSAEPGKSTKKRGAPQRFSLSEDRKIVEKWKTGKYKTFKELGRVLDIPAHDVKKAVGRHRKRK